MIAVTGGVEGEDAAVEVAQRDGRVTDGDEHALRVGAVQLHVDGVDDIVDRVAGVEARHQVAHVAREEREGLDGYPVDAGRRRAAVHDARLHHEAPLSQHGLVVKVGRVRMRDDLSEEGGGGELVGERDDERLARLRLLLGGDEPRELPDVQRPLLDDARQRHLEDADGADVVCRQLLLGVVGAARAVDAHVPVEYLRYDARPPSAHARPSRARHVAVDDLRQEARRHRRGRDEQTGAGEGAESREREEDEEQEEEGDDEADADATQRLAPAAAEVAADVVVELLRHVLGVVAVDELDGAQVVRLEDLHGAVAAAERRLAAVADRRDPRRVLIDQSQDGAVVAVDGGQCVVGVVDDGGGEGEPREEGGRVKNGSEESEEGDVEEEFGHGEHG